MLAGALLAAALSLTNAQLAKIDEAVQTVKDAGRISSLALGVAREGRVLLLRDGDTVYRIGSLTKQFTAALVLQQIERGTLHFDTRSHGVTVQELLAQTAGLPSFTGDPASVGAALESPPAFTPGSEWEYSNTNYYVLGTLLESASAVPYATLLQRSIATPLQLHETSLTDAQAFAAAGMSSSARDILTWLDALRSGKIVSAASFREMTTSQTLESGERTHYGYGWYIRDWYGWKTVEHSGYIDGYSADDAIVLDDGLEIVVLAKAKDAFLVPLTKSIVATLETPRDQSDVANFQKPAENENPTVTHDIGEIVHELQTSQLDRSRFSSHLNSTLTPAALRQGKQLLAPLGVPTLVEFISRTSHDSDDIERYRVSFGYRQFWMTLGYAQDGKIDALTIEPDED